jgi:hypothetical protein
MILSELYVGKEKKLCEDVSFGSRIVTYQINGITKHPIFGIYFSFNSKKKS